MPEDYEELLKTGLFDPPDDFVDQVMTKLAVQPLPIFPTHGTNRTERIQWLALIGASLLGAIQLAAFMFSIWSTTNVG